MVQDVMDTIPKENLWPIVIENRDAKMGKAVCKTCNIDIHGRRNIG